MGIGIDFNLKTQLSVTVYLKAHVHAIFFVVIFYFRYIDKTKATLCQSI